MTENPIVNREQKTRLIIIITIIIIAIILITLWLVGIKSILKFLGVLSAITFALAILGLLIYFIWELFFKKQKIDITYINKKKLIQAGIRNKPDYLQNLILSGDKGHTRVTFGRIIGYCRIQILTEQQEIDENGFQIYITNPRTNRKEPRIIILKEEQDVFIIEKRGFPFNIFTEPDVIRLHPLDHDDLIGDVTIKGISLIPVSEYWFLNSEHLRIDKIDKALLTEAKRGVMFLTLSDMKEIVDRAIGLDSIHQKGMENKNLVDMPIPGQQNQTQPPAI